MAQYSSGARKIRGVPLNAIADFTDRESWAAIQKSVAHLTKCLTALDKIRGIAGNGSPIWQIADDAMQNRPVNAGGTELNGY